MIAISEISEICTNKDWENIRHKVRKWDNDKLEALRIFLLSGIKPKESMQLVDYAIDLSVLTILTTKEAAEKIAVILNRFNNGL